MHFILSTFPIFPLHSHFQSSTIANWPIPGQSPELSECTCLCQGICLSVRVSRSASRTLTSLVWDAPFRTSISLPQSHTWILLTSPAWTVPPRTQLLPAWFWTATVESVWMLRRRQWHLLENWWQLAAFRCLKSGVCSVLKLRICDCPASVSLNSFNPWLGHYFKRITIIEI